MVGGESSTGRAGQEMPDRSALECSKSVRDADDTVGRSYPSHIALILDDLCAETDPKTFQFSNALDGVLKECSALGVQTLWIIVQKAGQDRSGLERTCEIVTSAIENLPGHTKAMCNIRTLSDPIDHPKKTQPTTSDELDTGDRPKPEVLIVSDYSAKSDIVRTIQAIAGGLDTHDSLEQTIDNQLMFGGKREPDLIIYFSDIKKFGAACVWAGAYSEFVFLPKHWSEFGIEDLRDCLEQFAERERRFGAVTAEAPDDGE